MRKLDYYLISEFLELFLPIVLTLIFLGSAYRLTTLGEIDQIYIDFKTTFIIFINLIPLILPIILSMSFFFSLVILLIKLRLSGELLGVFTSQISHRRVFNLFLKVALIISLLGFLNSLFVKPASARKISKLLDISSFDLIKNLEAGEIKKISTNTFLYAKEKTNNLKNIVYLKNSYPSNITILTAKELNSISLYGGELKCLFNEGRMLTIRGEDFTSYDFSTLFFNPFKNKIKSESEISPKIIPSFSLFYITKIYKDAYKEATELGERFFSNFAPIILLFVVFSLATSNRKDNYVSTILFCLTIVILHYSIFYTVYHYSKNGSINPLYSFFLLTLIELMSCFLLFKKRFARVF